MSFTFGWVGSRLGRALRATLLLASLSSAACTPREGAGAARPPVQDAAATAPLLSLHRGAWPSALETQPWWQAAAAGDEWAALQLSRSHGVSALAAQLAAGGPAARAAALAYPTAEQAWEMRGRLCQLLPAYEAAAWPVLLRALVHSAQQAGAIGERLDGEATSQCVRALDALEHKLRQGAAETGDPHALDWVQSARQALAWVPHNG